MSYARTSRSSTGTQGHLVGEIIRRITGKTLKEFVREEIAAPLGADIQIGARAEDDDRIAELVPPPPLDVPLDAVPEDHPMRKTFSAPPLTPETAEAANTIAWRRADIGASNGHGNARSLARALSPISLSEAPSCRAERCTTGAESRARSWQPR